MTFLGKRILAVVAAVGFGCMAASSASALTWNGSNSFNDASITFAGVSASQVSITGNGTYEGSLFWPIPTLFSMSLQWGNQWHVVDAWAVIGQDENPTALSTRGTITGFGLHTITGIMFSSIPNGVPNSDKNYNGMTGLNFNFALAVPEPGSTPLPAALPLMATVLFGAGAAAWRRRRRNAANVAA